MESLLFWVLRGTAANVIGALRASYTWLQDGAEKALPNFIIAVSAAPRHSIMSEHVLVIWWE
jgi:hypothetical protein